MTNIPSFLRSSLRFVFFFGAFALLSGAATRASAQNTELVFNFDNEAENAGWLVQGGAGIDRGLGLSYSGLNNGWIRTSNTSFNSLRHGFTARGKACNAVVWLRTSKNLTRGAYITILDANTWQILGERFMAPEHIKDPSVPVQYSPWGAYVDAPVAYQGQPMIVRVGFWGPGHDAWIQVDDVHVWC